MAKIQEVTGLVTCTLGVDPRIVSLHLQGLVESGRIDPRNPVTASACADLLCACLSTDPANATGPYHLPLSGGGRFDDRNELVEIIDHTHAFFDAIDMSFGEILTDIIASRARASQIMGIVHNVVVSGAGEQLTASVMLHGQIGPEQQGKAWLTYGYKLLPRLLSEPLYGPRLKVSNTIGGHILDQFGALVGGRSVWEVPGVFIPTADAGAQ